MINSYNIMFNVVPIIFNQYVKKKNLYLIIMFDNHQYLDIFILNIDSFD